MNTENILDIGDVSRQTGLPVSTLRFYESKGLITSVGRNGLRRLFDGNIIERLSLITLGRTAGFTLEEIASMFTPNGIDIDRKKLADKAEELQNTIKQLTTVYKGLIHASQCPEDNHLACPKFRRIMRVATKANPQT